MPGADYQLTKLLGLRPSVKRPMMYQQGCFAGGPVLRLAKDLAENNRGARVLLVCSEITGVTFCGPSDTHLDSLVGQAFFSDSAAALIVGSNADISAEAHLREGVCRANQPPRLGRCHRWTLERSGTHLPSPQERSWTHLQEH